MRIWIVSSDPFLNDFEEIAKLWPSNTEIYITTLTKYGEGILSYFVFLKDYLTIKPDKILTDHGYFGFFFVKIYSKILKKDIPITMFLRGNYWLEERKRRENSL